MIAAGRVGRGVAALALVVGSAGVGTLATASVTAPAAAAGTCTAPDVALVVDFTPWASGFQGNGSAGNRVSACVPFTSGMKGIDLFTRGGFTTAGTAHDGPAFLCRINGLPAASGNPSPRASEPCSLTPPASAYWSYWYAKPGATTWTYSSYGAYSNTVTAGRVEAWVYGGTDIAGTTGQPSFSPQSVMPAAAPELRVGQRQRLGGRVRRRVPGRHRRHRRVRCGRWCGSRQPDGRPVQRRRDRGWRDPVDRGRPCDGGQLDRLSRCGDRCHAQQFRVTVCHRHGVTVDEPVHEPVDEPVGHAETHPVGDLPVHRRPLGERSPHGGHQRHRATGRREQFRYPVGDGRHHRRPRRGGPGRRHRGVATQAGLVLTQLEDPVTSQAAPAAAPVRGAQRARGPVRLPRDLHPMAWWAWAIGLVAAASRTTNPLLLLLILAAAAVVVTARRTEAPWARAFKFYLGLGVSVIAIRIGFRIVFGGDNSPGSHVLFTLWQIPLPSWMAGVQLGGPVTAESTLGALYDGLRLATLLCCIGAANALANPKRALRAIPGALYEIGVAVVVAVSVAPQLVESLQRVRRARRLRGGGGSGLRALRSIAMPVLQDALERSLLLAAAMDSRGYGRRVAVPAALRRTTAGLLLAGLIGLCVGAYGVLDGTAPAALGLPALVVGAVMCIGGIALGGRRIAVTQYRPDPWRAAEWAVLGCGLACAVVMLVSSGYDSANLNPSLSPLSWPTLPLVPVLAVVIAALPAVLAPPPVTAASRREQGDTP